MTGNTLWQNLKSLVELDKQISIIEQEINTLKKGLEHDSQVITRQQDTLSNMQQVYKNEQKSVDFIELNIKDLKDKEKNKSLQLDNVSNPKEYRALEKEIENINRRLVEQERLLEVAFDKLEKAKEDFDTGSKDLVLKNDQLEKDIVLKNSLIDELVAKIESFASSRAEALKSVPEEWQQKYERMRHSVADPVVAAVSGTCGACFYSVPHQDMIRLKNHGVLLCRNCYRFLYFESESK